MRNLCLLDTLPYQQGPELLRCDVILSAQMSPIMKGVKHKQEEIRTTGLLL